MSKISNLYYQNINFAKICRTTNLQGRGNVFAHLRYKQRLKQQLENYIIYPGIDYVCKQMSSKPNQCKHDRPTDTTKNLQKTTLVPKD